MPTEQTPGPHPNARLGQDPGGAREASTFSKKVAQTMELLRYALLLRRWLWLLLLGSILAGTTAFLVSRQMTPIYEASTTLLISQSSNNSAYFDYNSILSSERLTRTYAQLLVKRPVLTTVIDTLGLSQTPEQIARMITVSPVRDTQLVVMKVKDSDPARAAAIANNVAETFIAQNPIIQAESTARSIGNLEQELARLQANIDATQASLKGLEPGETSDERSRLEQALVQYRSSHTSVLKSLEELRQVEARQASSIKVAEAAVAPQLPVRPRPFVNTILAAMLGLLVTMSVALLIEYLGDKVTSPEEAAAMLQSSTLATIGKIEGQTPADKLVSLKDPYAHTAEAYQMLRVRLEIARFDQALQTLLITSGSPGEGKSTTAANLAVAIARTGKQVILVDADLRRPSLHRFFNHHNLRGVTTALVREAGTSLDEHFQSTKIDNLLLLPSGPLPADPMAVLSSPRMATLIAEIKSRAEVIIFDTPPLLVVADATLLARSADATLLVARAGATRNEALRRAGEMLAEAGITLAGVVLNEATKEQGGYGQYYYGGDKRRRSPLAGIFRPVTTFFRPVAQFFAPVADRFRRGGGQPQRPPGRIQVDRLKAAEVGSDPRGPRLVEKPVEPR